nr:unnamed protein product [Spirometra erinaceieuropaei]
MRVFITEHLNYWYSVQAYYLAKTFADLPFQIIFPLIYGIIVYWMTDQPAEFARFMIFLVVCVQTALVGQSLGLVIGAATDLEVAVFLGPATGIPILLFSGFFVTLDAIPKYLQWLSYSSFTRYAFEGAMKGIYGGNRSTLNCTKSQRSPVSIPCIPNPQSVLSFLNISSYNFIIDFTVLNIFFIFLRVLCFIVLYAKAKSST